VDFWLDVVLAIGFVLAYSFGFTGAWLHEWIGIGLGAALIVHLTLHWEWVAHTAKRFATVSGRRRILAIVNLALLISMTLCVMSGIYISAVALPAVGVHSLGGSSASFVFWKRLHKLLAKVTLGLVPVHIAMDWPWIVGHVRRLVRARTGRSTG
jgi:hypothetical protein